MELLRINRSKMITAILHDYYSGVIEAANDNPSSFSSYSVMADSDPMRLAAFFTNGLRLVLEQKPTYEICSIYAEIQNNN